MKNPDTGYETYQKKAESGKRKMQLILVENLDEINPGQENRNQIVEAAVSEKTDEAEADRLGQQQIEATAIYFFGQLI